MSIAQTIHIIDQALAMLPGAMDTPEARVLLLAIGLQESLLFHRRQLVGKPPRPVGPAKGLWQFELGGGCAGVVRHAASRYWMARVCHERGCAFDPRSLWDALEHDDVLAATAARLLLFTDPQRLPAFGDEEGAWQLYLRVWRPGAWARGTPSERQSLRRKWADYYAAAVNAVAALA